MVGLIAGFFLMQVAHAPYNTFYSIYLAETGYSKTAIGWLWALGVIAEIVLFFWLPQLIRRWRLEQILLACFWFAIVRFLSFWKSDTFPWGTPVNAGGGLKNCLSLLELVGLMENMKIGFNKPSFSDWRHGDQKIFYSDNSLAFKLLNWSPKIKPSDGVEKLWRWIEQNISTIEKLLESKN